MESKKGGKERRSYRIILPQAEKILGNLGMEKNCCCQLHDLLKKDFFRFFKKIGDHLLNLMQTILNS